MGEVPTIPDEPPLVCGSLGTGRGCGALLTKESRLIVRSPTTGITFCNTGYVEVFDAEQLCEACAGKLPPDWRKVW